MADAVVVVPGDNPPAPSPTDAVDVAALVEAARLQGEAHGAAMQSLTDRLALTEAANLELTEKVNIVTGQYDGLRLDLNSAHERIGSVENAHNETRGRLDETIAFLETTEDDDNVDDPKDPPIGDPPADPAPVGDPPSNPTPTPTPSPTPSVDNVPVRRRHYQS